MILNFCWVDSTKTIPPTAYPEDFLYFLAGLGPSGEDLTAQYYSERSGVSKEMLASLGLRKQCRRMVLRSQESDGLGLRISGAVSSHPTQALTKGCF